MALTSTFNALCVFFLFFFFDKTKYAKFFEIILGREESLSRREALGKGA